MKVLLMFLTLFIITTLHLSAQNIDTQMQEIREASPSQKVRLMNELKRQIAKMNQNDRTDAINTLRTSRKKRDGLSESVNRQQFQNSQEMIQKQQQNQQQSGNQYMKNKDGNKMKFNK